MRSYTIKAVPRRRGDEPADVRVGGAIIDLFPAGAGMNRHGERAYPVRRSCSPQARG